MAGRPSAAAAEQLEMTILDRATEAFLRDGYAATTIEGIAQSSGTAKRTIYARYTGKPALFRAVADRLIATWLSFAGDWPEGPTLRDSLTTAADRILQVALTPEAVALHRLMIAESARFPELPGLLHQAGADQGTGRLAALLARAIEQQELPAIDIRLAAEQFMHLLLAGPQRRLLGLGTPLDEQQTLAWRDAAIDLFLRGVTSFRLP
jgi:TetR/AcrR family transcriptional repressor of mexJK operon